MAKEVCWICGKNTLSMHEHHVVPQAYGGRKGVTVWLCPTHHDSLHVLATKISTAMERGETNFLNLIPNSSESKKMLMLADYIIEAKHNGTGERIYKVTLELTEEQHKILKWLKRELNCSSLPKTVMKCIAVIYKRTRSR